MGTFTRIHIRLPSPWNARLVAHTRILPWITSEIKRATRCNCWRIILVTYTRERRSTNGKDVRKSRLVLERRATLPSK